MAKSHQPGPKPFHCLYLGMEWLKHPVINTSHVCELLFGDRQKATVSKFHKKLQGKFGSRHLGFTAEEQQRLEEIRKQLLAEIADL